MADQQKLKRNPDDPKFWQQHVEQHQVARCSKLAYCRKNELTYHRFLYWAGKFKKGSVAKKPLPPFVPLQCVKPKLENNLLLASIALKNDVTLQIHNRTVLFDLVKQLS